MTSRPPRVLVLSMSFGSGHMRAAAAVGAAIRVEAPEADVRVLDALVECSLPFRAIYAWSYWAMLRWAPSLWRRLFTSRLRHVTRHTAPGWLFRAGCARVFRAIRAFAPDVIVAAEVGACELAVLARRTGVTTAPIVAVITDAQAEPAWVAPEVAHYAVPNEEVRYQLAGWGARASSVAVTGIALDRAFAARTEAASVERGATPRVLLMGGGMGPTRMDEVAAELGSSRIPMTIVAVAGHDRRAHRKLRRVPLPEPASLSILGWTDDVAELMRSADILVTKPGGITTAEAAACGVATVLFDPIPGPEEANARRLVKHGAALLTRGSRAAAQAVLLLLRDPARREQMRAAAYAMATPHAAQTIAQLALGCVRDPVASRETSAPAAAPTRPAAWEAGS